MSRIAAGFVFACLLAGCAPMKSRIQQALEMVGVDRHEQREFVQQGKEIALAPGRHGSAGMYASGAANPEFRGGGGGEIGAIYNGYCWEAKAGVAAYVSGSSRGYFVGPTAAVHVQLPTRLTPFAGAGVFAGWLEKDTDRFDGADERITDYDTFATVFPEVGVNYWLTDYVRLTTSASYHFTTEGRGHDFWTVGGGIAVLFP